MSANSEPQRGNAQPRPAGNGGALPVALFTFALWGVLPVYWKFFGEVPALEVLAHRVLWSFVFTSGLIIVTGRIKELKAELAKVLADRRKLTGLVLASVLVCFNWLTFIWAVNHDRVVESSLGYYINPLLNVLIGVAVLRERLSGWQAAAVFLAFIGVAYLTVSHGSLPVVSLILAGSMSVYGLLKKITGLSAVIGMTLETAVTAPVALIYFIFLYGGGGGYPIGFSLTFVLLLGAGAVTSTPLMMFAYSLNRLPYSQMGLIQYISPTLTLLLGVFVYGEPFTQAHLTAFAFIWAGLIVYTVSSFYRGNLRRVKKPVASPQTPQDKSHNDNI